jgi:hypothetical protein
MTVSAITRLSGLISIIGAITLLGASPSKAANLVTNGDFETGLTGWSVDNPSGHPTGVATFDIDGDDSLGSSNAFFARTGGGFGSQPVNLSQTLSLIGGQSYSFFANIASFPVFDNASGGVVTASINGVTVSSFDFESVIGGFSEFATLTGNYQAATTGSYLLNINFFRPFTSTPSTPINYIDNIALNEQGSVPTSVPEPASALGLLAFGTLAQVH